jgi:hypothetical protein
MGFGRRFMTIFEIEYDAERGGRKAPVQPLWIVKA